MIEFSFSELIAILWAILATVWGAHQYNVAQHRGRLLNGATQLFEHMLKDEAIFQRLREDYKKSGADGVFIGE